MVHRACDHACDSFLLKCIGITTRNIAAIIIYSIYIFHQKQAEEQEKEEEEEEKEEKEEEEEEEEGGRAMAWLWRLAAT